MSSCAYVHRVSVGDIDDRREFNRTYFELKVSELGVETEAAVKIAGAIVGMDKKDRDGLSGIIKLFQMGPVTGNLVYNETYAENILSRLLQKCPDGKLSNLVTIRETNKYPVISGEIVKITGHCLR